MTAIGMLSSKADGAPTIGSAYASINYHEGTGLPYQTPGISRKNSPWRNIQNIMLWIGATIQYGSENRANRPIGWECQYYPLIVPENFYYDSIETSSAGDMIRYSSLAGCGLVVL